LFAVFLLIICGCGSGGTVSGTVTLDGNPLPGAKVEFTPKTGGRPGSGETDDQGKYQLKYLVDDPALPPGEYSVTIRTATSKEDESGKTIDIPEKLPPKYHAESELVREVIDGENSIDFELTTK